MKPYLKYKDSGIEWIGEIPEHWKIVKLKRETQFLYGESLSNENRLEGKVPVYGSNGVTGYHNEAITKSPCIVIGRKGSFGKVNYSDKECFPIDTTFYIDTTATHNDLLWLYYLLLTVRLDSFSKDSAVPGLNREEAYERIISLPPFSEQQSIANYLDRKTHQIDTLIENKQEQIDLLKEQRAAIINQAVTKGLNPAVKLKDSGIEWLGEIPEHWGIARLKFISNIKYGLGQPPRALEEGLPIIRATNIKEGKISPDDLLYVDPKDVPYDRDPILKENDIIVVRSGAYTGDSAIIPREYGGAVAGYDMVACVHKANPEYIAYSLLSHSILHNQIDLCRLRAAQPHLNAEELGDTLVFLPPNDEQKMIVEFIKHESEMIVSINQNLEELIKCLKEYRTALISEVVTGKIDVRDSGEQEVIHS